MAFAQVGGFFFGALIADDFYSDHQAAAANVAYDFEFLVQSAIFAKRLVAHAARVFLVFGTDQVHGG